MSEPMHNPTEPTSDGDARALAILVTETRELDELISKMKEFATGLQSNDPACSALLEDLKSQLASQDESLQSERELPSSEETASEVTSIYADLTEVLQRFKAILPDQLPEPSGQDEADSQDAPVSQ
jgi:ABC-type transporter Mla subunit MlaD